MIKIRLKGRKQSDTYLATIRRHCWSAQMMMKKDNKLELYYLFSIVICALQRCLRIVARQVSLYFLPFNIIKIILEISSLFLGKRKKQLNRGERRETNLTHVCTVLWNRHVSARCRSFLPCVTTFLLRNVLTRRREYGTYLATARRHRRRLKMQKRDE